MYDVRLSLSKLGKVKYVSHLDMFRLMGRAVRRAEIPLWYTEGFNPHPYISFLLALPLGVEGLREPVDIRITGEMSLEEIKQRLNSCMPGGLTVEDVRLPFNKPAEIAYGEYFLSLDSDMISSRELGKLLSGGGLSCLKSGKSGGKKIMKTVNVSEHIKHFEISENESKTELKVILPAGSVFNLNPLQLLEALSEKHGKTLYSYDIKRTGLLCADMTTFV